MDIEGMIVMDLPLQEGVSKAGNPWKKKEWVIETAGAFPRKVKFTVFGERRISEMPFEVGKNYRINVELESREFNGRWYTDVNALSSMQLDGGMAAAAPVAETPLPPFGELAADPLAPSADSFGGIANDTDDLPF